MKEFLGRLFKEPIALLVVLAAIALLVVHIIYPDEFGIDAITIGLLAIILISPYLRFITRIRFGEFAVDISRRHVEELERKTRAVPEAGEKPAGKRASGLQEMLLQIAESDPSLAVVRLAIELENRLRRLAELVSISEKREPPVRAGIRQLSQFLLKSEVINRSVFDAISVLADMRNKVVHGGRVEEEYAFRVLGSGVSIIQYLESLLEEEIGKPIEVQKINQEEVVETSEARYKVVTIVPYVGEPEKRTYIFTQEELNSFLEGYEEYAEYIILLEKVQRAKQVE